MTTWPALFRRRLGKTCATCSRFQGDPAAIESLLPGLTVMGSAYASVAAGDGVCTRHDTIESRRSCCRDHTAIR